MSLSDLNTTPTHERGIIHHVVFHHPKRGEDGRIVYNDDGSPIIDRIEPLFNDGKPVEMIIAGPDSDRVAKGQALTFDIQRRAAFDERPVTISESIEGNVSRWSAAVIGWNNLPKGWVKGYDPKDPKSKAEADTPIDYSDDHAKAMLAQIGMVWLGQQIDEVLKERNRFLPVGSANSAPTPPTSSDTQKAASRRRSRAS